MYAVCRSVHNNRLGGQSGVTSFYVLAEGVTTASKECLLHIRILQAMMNTCGTWEFDRFKEECRGTTDQFQRFRH